MNRNQKVLCKLSALALSTFLSCAVQAETIVVPYFYTWGFGNGAYKFKTLAEARQRAGMDGATLAFAVSGGGCSIGGGMEVTLNNPTVAADVRQFVADGGKLILSFGGAAGTYLESVCSANDLVALIRKLMNAHGVRAIDFDIEGAQLEDTRLNSVRNAAIKQLQAMYPDLYVSFTLPVSPYLNASDTGGLPALAIKLVRGAAQAGVKISVVNIMTMDYGAYYSAGRKMGDLAVSAAQQTFGQLKGIYPDRTDAQLWAMIGITPMIGKNDVATEVFTPADARTVATFAKQKKLGLLAMWAMQRDRVGSGGLDGYSNANTRDYEFYQTLATAKDDAPAPPNAPLANGSYRIKSAFSGLCLEIEGASAANGAKVQQSACSSAASQLFAVTQDAGGGYRIANANSGKSLDVTDVSMINGALIQQWSATAGENQRFTLSIDGTAYRVQARHSAMCVDVKDWNPSAGGRIQQWDCTQGSNQRWEFVAAAAAPVPTAADLTDARKKDIAMQLVSSAENSSLDWRAQYAYIQDIGDGRGYTAGTIGFCSGTGDMLLLVTEYTRRSPNNLLAKYLPALRAVNGSASHSGLDPNFRNDWRSAAADPAWRAAQDDERDAVYFNPAVQQAKQDGLHALGQFIYYDAIFMHGPGNDGVSFGGIRKAALKKAKPPSQGGSETAYLHAFLDARVAAMKTEQAHSDTSRVDAAQRLFLEAGNLNLDTPLTWRVYGDRYSIP
jgi:Glycosyl hydrolase family 46/Ricin-type beta-trefoil lectin domain-like